MSKECVANVFQIVFTVVAGTAGHNECGHHSVSNGETPVLGSAGRIASDLNNCARYLENEVVLNAVNKHHLVMGQFNRANPIVVFLIKKNDHLVAENRWDGEPDMSVHGMEIGVTNTRADILDKDLAGCWHRHLKVPDLGLALDLEADGGLHGGGELRWRHFQFRQICLFNQSALRGDVRLVVLLRRYKHGTAKPLFITALTHAARSTVVGRHT